MWQDIVDQVDKWIGGKLIDHGDSMDRLLLKEGLLPAETIITGFSLTEEFFTVNGETFDCGGSRDIVGICGEHVENGLALRGYGGHRFDIVKPWPEGNTETP